MIATKHFENQYVQVREEMINICYGKKSYEISMANIRKMYLAKRKTRLAGFLENLVMRFDDHVYKLCIRTKDDKETIIRIRPFERQYFIGIIAMVRNRNSDLN